MELQEFDFSQDYYNEITADCTTFDSWLHPFWTKLNLLRQELGFSDDFLSSTPILTPRNNERNKEDKNTLCEKIKGLILRYSDFQEPIFVLDRKSWKNVEFRINSGIHLRSIPKKYSQIGIKRQAQTLNLLCRIYVLLSNNRHQTQRDLGIYESSATLNQLLEDICCQLFITKTNINVKTVRKGSIYGEIEIILNNESISCISSKSGFAIPYNLDDIEEVKSEAKFILVIEKDASFQYCIESNLVDKMPVILITGKGFPDSNTREFLRILVDKLSIPVLGLIDGDPYGIEILCVYRFGSLSMAHNSYKCVVPELRWIGMHPSDITRWKIPDHCLSPLTRNDRNKIEDIIKRPYMPHNPAYLQEITYLKAMGKKAGIQALFEINDEFLCHQYLPLKIKNGDWI